MDEYNTIHGMHLFLFIFMLWIARMFLISYMIASRIQNFQELMSRIIYILRCDVNPIIFTNSLIIYIDNGVHYLYLYFKMQIIC